MHATDMVLLNLKVFGLRLCHFCCKTCMNPNICRSIKCDIDRILYEKDGLIWFLYYEWTILKGQNSYLPYYNTFKHIRA